MKTLDYTELNKFIASDVIKPFYELRLDRLKSATLADISRRKNPYLFKAKNIGTAGDLAKNILDAFLSSQEETIFGALMENLAIHICKEVFDGVKAEEGKYKSIDLIFEKDEKIYIVGIKSGPNWGNADQINAMKKNFGLAKTILKGEGVTQKIIAVNGCIYGRENRRAVHANPKYSYFKLCGQAFWELISGDEDLYKKLIQPLDEEAKNEMNILKNYMTKRLMK